MVTKRMGPLTIFLSIFIQVRPMLNKLLIVFFFFKTDSGKKEKGQRKCAAVCRDEAAITPNLTPNTEFYT